MTAVSTPLLLLAACARGPAEPVPDGYPAAYADLERAADAERGLLIWSAIDKVKAGRLIADFQAIHPNVRVTYIEMPAREINDRIMAATATGGEIPDFLWSSAMDLQIKLVNDGYAQSYRSPERDNLPDWANWKDQAWGITAEPIVMVYNRAAIADAAMPRTHTDLTKFLERSAGKPGARVATSDPVSSAVGYLYLSQDQQATHDIWRLVRAMGANDVKLFTSAENVVRAVEAGDAAIGYNIVGSFALGEVERNQQLGMILPSDYTLLMSRIAVIPAAARHPNAAKVFLDFLLSRRGQTHLVDQDMPSVRADVRSLTRLQPEGLRPRAIRVGPGLLVDQDQLTRRYFLERWRTSLAKAQQ
ncbi:ABC transporter substrate-binding protein [Sphingomonas panacisoli]|nr:ABC transporter substrate-binding protein [Sphingomonas panacisoli]